jgi:hypothetical protein
VDDEHVDHAGPGEDVGEVGDAQLVRCAGLKCRRIRSAGRSEAAAGVVVAPATVHRAASVPSLFSCSQASGARGLVAVGVLPAQGRPGVADGQNRPAMSLLRELLG